MVGWEGGYRKHSFLEDQVPRVAAPSDHLPDVGPVPGGEEAFPMQVRTWG